mmetsp:Transcript_11043/g.12629  ORF Transcript_11043/g.12629 Transcript_11043/m.12629 type:complete len:291 (+) Transcript_11043:146-1018(+)
MTFSNIDILSNNEKQFFNKLLESTKIRYDGRNHNETREVTVSPSRTTRSIDQCRAQCQASIGDTKAMAVVSCDLVEPYPDRPTEGMLTISTTLSSMASEEYEFRKQSSNSEASKTSHLIELAVKESKALDIEALCVVAGSKVWHIRCDIHILNHAGNVVDAGCLAALGALVHFRRPEVSVVGTDVTVHPLDEREPVSLSIHHLPFCVSFGLYRHDMKPNSREKIFILSDTTEREEAFMHGRLTVVLNQHAEISGIHKQGWPPLSTSNLNRCIEIATERAKEWSQLVSALK